MLPFLLRSDEPSAEKRGECDGVVEVAWEVF